jgi:hypothetical protein
MPGSSVLDAVSTPYPNSRFSERLCPVAVRAFDATSDCLLFFLHLDPVVHKPLRHCKRMQANVVPLCWHRVVSGHRRTAAAVCPNVVTARRASL